MCLRSWMLPARGGRANLEMHASSLLGFATRSPFLFTVACPFFFFLLVFMFVTNENGGAALVMGSGLNTGCRRGLTCSRKSLRNRVPDGTGTLHDFFVYRLPTSWLTLRRWAMCLKPTSCCSCKKPMRLAKTTLRSCPQR
eukprot:m.795972 g.795972  ORF g.795972 m.795972 type:complete len:140 (-) comp59245_c0_seq26:192-611(-)